MAPGSTHHASHAGGAAAGGGGDDGGGDAAAGCERQQRLEQRTANIAGAAATILANIAGEDGGREGLQRTPERFARAWAFFTSGYAKSVRQECNGAVFAVAGADMVLVRDVDVCSLCEHHLVPFVGKIHMAYVPRGRVLGLSKLVRIVEIFARRLQVQERLTQEVAGAIDDVLGPEGVVVVAECTHMCMSMRGVQRPGATTVSQCRRGVFERDAHVYEQFSALLRKR